MDHKKDYIVLGLSVAAIAALSLTLSSCVSIPKGAKAVSPFEKDKYLGKWYEIARLDFKFEKGLDHVSATYSLIDSNVILVQNKGYSLKQDKWKESTGRAKLTGNGVEGRLKVSFFGPFYSGYNVIAIDPQYRYAMVAGNNLNYLWLLSREKNMPEDVKNDYLKKAKLLGYDIQKLVWTEQN